VQRSVVVCKGAGLFIDPFRVDAGRDAVVVVVMLNDLSCCDLALHDAWWGHFPLKVLALAITRTIEVGREGWSG
jgi:hypothetical protein